jgi:hypothetical protein
LIAKFLSSLVALKIMIGAANMGRTVTTSTQNSADSEASEAGSKSDQRDQQISSRYDFDQFFPVGLRERL